MSRADFLANIPFTNECVNWPGASTPEGYGRLRFAGKTQAAHRVAFEIRVGAIPANHFVCHRCDNPRCVNPAHLFVADHAGNMRDMLAKGREQPWGRKVTHCPQGHSYSESNTYRHKGIRYCRQCVNKRSREYQRRARAEE